MKKVWDTRTETEVQPGPVGPVACFVCLAEVEQLQATTDYIKQPCSRTGDRTSFTQETFVSLCINVK